MRSGLPDFGRSLGSLKARRAGFAYPLKDGRSGIGPSASHALAAAEARLVRGNHSYGGHNPWMGTEPDLREHFMFTFECKLGAIAFLWDFGGGSSNASLLGCHWAACLPKHRRPDLVQCFISALAGRLGRWALPLVLDVCGGHALKRAVRAALQAGGWNSPDARYTVAYRPGTSVVTDVLTFSRGRKITFHEAEHPVALIERNVARRAMYEACRAEGLLPFAAPDTEYVLEVPCVVTMCIGDDIRKVQAWGTVRMTRLPGLLAFQLADRSGSPPAWFAREGAWGDVYFRLVAFVGRRVVATPGGPFYHWPRVNKLGFHALRLEDTPHCADLDMLRQCVARDGPRTLHCIRFSHFFISTDAEGQGPTGRCSYPKDMDALRSFAERAFDADRARRDAAARAIQERVRECMSNPSHPMCVRRLVREFQALTEA